MWSNIWASIEIGSPEPNPPCKKPTEECHSGNSAPPVPRIPRESENLVHAEPSEIKQVAR
ncbi:hypothetical protein BOTBODRAFT_370841 [Botryobasidium botryosum FD-172 SS1]|uniref:Uncharacterized protein n=1 Tax=Botryobasidium botryosum (strain FD-172 SS1) TaxID=930990 RepID=A0A067MCQ7_BOTB1|nr:hypothetical protein BOTBODRAFT_370841 [Botryobasidium botryosum FD-172 SS1]